MYAINTRGPGENISQYSIHVFQLANIRYACAHTTRQKLRPKKLQQKVTILEKIKELIRLGLKWFGHVTRLNDRRLICNLGTRGLRRLTLSARPRIYRHSSDPCHSGKIKPGPACVSWARPSHARQAEDRPCPARPVFSLPYILFHFRM